MKRTLRSSYAVVSAAALGLSGLAALPASTAHAEAPPSMVRLSAEGDGKQVAYGDVSAESVSADGQHVVYLLRSRVWTLDRATGVRVSQDIAVGGTNSGVTWHAVMTPAARHIAFATTSPLVADDTNGRSDIYVRDRDTDADGVLDETAATSLQRVSVGPDGSQGNGDSWYPQISDDGSVVSWQGRSTNWGSSVWATYVRDRGAGATTRATNGSQEPAHGLSGDGRYLVWRSYANTEGVSWPHNDQEVFLLDRTTGVTSGVGRTPEGTFAYPFSPTISRDGRYIAVSSYVSSLVPGDTNGQPDVFVIDRQSGLWDTVNRRPDGTIGSGRTERARFSTDSAYLAFAGSDGGLVADDRNGHDDAFVRSLHGTRRTGRTATTVDGAEPNGWVAPSAVSDGARAALVTSAASNLVGGDTNGPDAFARTDLDLTKAPTAVTLTSSKNPGDFGETFVFTATVVVEDGSGGIPSGSLTFYDNDRPIPATLNSNGRTTWTVALGITPGTHVIRAEYAGSTGFLPSTAAPLTQVVHKAPTATSLTASSTGAEYGQPLSFTARVTPTVTERPLTGSVRFTAGDTTATVPLSSGTATWSTASLPVGTHEVRAEYTGDDLHAPSAAPPVAVEVAGHATSTTISSASPSRLGEPASLTAQVTSGAGVPTGSVTFLDGPTVLGTAPVDGTGSATLSTSSLTEGLHEVRARFTGTGGYAGSESLPVAHTVVAPVPTTTTLLPAGWPGPEIVWGSSLTFTAKVAGRAGVVPTGTVTFRSTDGGSQTVPLSPDGSAQWSHRFAPPNSFGDYRVTAGYSGDADHAASTSDWSNVRVVKVTTSTTLSASSDHSAPGEDVTFTATVSGNGGTPTSSVHFYDGGTLLGSRTIGPDTTSVAFTTTWLTAGTRTITAQFVPNGVYEGSTSSPLQHTVRETGSLSATLAGGETVSTDSAGTGPTADVPVHTAITVPSGVSGELSIEPEQTDATAPSGFSLFGEQVVVHAPAATATDPYVVTFAIDASQLGAVLPADVQIFRNGSLVADCTHPEDAVPDPCVVSRAALGGGDAAITLRTSGFSTWSFGRLAYALQGPFAPVAAFPAKNVVKAGSAVPVKFSLTGYRGTHVLAAGSPSSVAVACNAPGAVSSSASAAAGSPSLTYSPGNDRYSFVWKTERFWSGCRDLTLRFRDGSVLQARFQLR